MVKYDVRKIDDILYELSLVRDTEGGGVEGVVVRGEGKKREREPEEQEAGRTGGGEGLDVLDVGEFEEIRTAMAAFDEKRREL